MPESLNPDGSFGGAAAVVGAAYLEQLTDSDLRVLTAGTPVGRAAADPVRAIRGQPHLVTGLLARPETLDSLLGASSDSPFAHAPEKPGQGRLLSGDLLPASPFLVFAATVERCAAELAGATHVQEWLGPRQRVAVLGTGELRAFLDDPWRRLFLAELLGSYTRVSSGSVMVRTRRGWRRQRFSELDPVRLAGLLDVVPEAERPGVFRRLGDLALFLTGVFPDHTADAGFGAVGENRLRRAGSGPAGRVGPAGAGSGGPGAGGPGGDAPAFVSFGDPGAVGLLEELGRRWYRLAVAGVPPPRPRNLQVVGHLADRFGDARRVLNVITDRYLFPLRNRWFNLPGQ